MDFTGSSPPSEVKLPGRRPEVVFTLAAPHSALDDILESQALKHH